MYTAQKYTLFCIVANVRVVFVGCFTTSYRQRLLTAAPNFATPAKVVHYPCKDNRLPLQREWAIIAGITTGKSVDSFSRRIVLGRNLKPRIKQETDQIWPASLSSRRLFELSYLDSNQDKQNQNLLCYHYTIGQSSCASFRKSGAKLVFFICSCKLFVEILQKSTTNTLSEPYSAMSKK